MLLDFSGRWQYRMHYCRFLGSARIQNKGMIVGESQFPIMGGWLTSWGFLLRCVTMSGDLSLSLSLSVYLCVCVSVYFYVCYFESVWRWKCSSVFMMMEDYMMACSSRLFSWLCCFLYRFSILEYFIYSFVYFPNVFHTWTRTLTFQGFNIPMWSCVGMLLFSLSFSRHWLVLYILFMRCGCSWRAGHILKLGNFLWLHTFSWSARHSAHI